MKTRYRLIRRGARGGGFYCVDTESGKRTSLQTASEVEARQIVEANNQALRQPAINLQIAQAYLRHGDPAMTKRTWQDVMDATTPLKTGPTQARWKSAMRDTAFDPLRGRKLIETNAEHFFAVLHSGTISTNMFLRRLHNFAVGMHWLPWPVLPKLQWPAVKHKERRAITPEEHRKIVEREQNPEIRAYYQMLWHLGGAQTDIAELTAEDVDWQDRTISFCRNKTGVRLTRIWPLEPRKNSSKQFAKRFSPSVENQFWERPIFLHLPRRP